MKYVVVTPLVVFCFEHHAPPEKMLQWLKLDVSLVHCLFTNVCRVKNMIPLGSDKIWVVDNTISLLPNGQIPLDYADYVIDSKMLGF